MNKKDRLYKLFQGSDTAVWAHDEIVNQGKRIAELEEALLWARDSNTGFEPSVSVMYRYYDELLPKGGAE